jgi:gliding motility-associated-like protein
VIFDEQFNLHEARLYATPFNESLSMIHVLPSGETAITTLHYSAQKAIYGFIDNNGRLMTQRSVHAAIDMVPMDHNYNFTFHNADWTYQERGNSKVSIVNNLTIGAGRYIELAFTNKSAPTLPCFGTDTSVMSVLPLLLTSTNFPWSASEPNRVIADPAHFTITDYRVQKDVLCKLAAACNQLNIVGKDTVCNTSQPYDYVIRKGECSKPVRWTFERDWITSADQVNDSILRLSFKQPISSSQEIKLYASLSDCMIADSLTITLLPSARQLPPDTIICGNTNITLNAGSGMKNYLWQDGSSDSIYQTRSKGLHTVVMEDFCGNRQFDTMQISDPFVYLGKDTSICAGNFVELKANTGFATYNWTATNYMRLSENAIRFSPATTGNYIVSAATADGCLATDTIRIQVHPPVSGFIFRDTTICTYEDITLKPTSTFTSYLWNDGSTGSSLFINKPGDYWLEVTNQNGCKGRQDIEVRSKPCDTYVRFPSAFTPNQDSRNDIFKPMIAGRLSAYRFEVYNRWGQKVFASTDPKKGWDGTISGTIQADGIFVWSCQYQLQGEAKVVEKGTVMLIR